MTTRGAWGRGVIDFGGQHRKELLSFHNIETPTTSGLVDYFVHR